MPAFRLAAFLLFFAAAAAACAQDLPAAPPAVPHPASPASTREFHNLPYVAGGHERQRLDLYLPAGEGKHPLVVWIHGGGWEGGNKDNCPAKALVARGYAAASIGYRLSQHAIFPAQIEDCKAAIRWLRTHADEYGIDPTRVGAWGASAGGHLVALLGTTGQTRDFDVGENLEQPSSVQCVIDWFGPADLQHWGDSSTEAARDKPNTPLAHLIGGTITTHPAEARRASPVTYVHPSASPFLIMHGDKDATVPLSQSEELDALLRKAGVESTLVIVPGSGHGGPEFTNPENRALMVRFLDKHLMMPN